ncbi:EAL domain-containing protein [Citrobacter sp. RHB25-C09]|uniref:EAL domain-containing protein n=1 Tax=Citrobacter sp. RHB25-C09 TaxID=2742624 RepID=UPI0015EE919F|nr:EAL domain-containing protein [Citrobacter sp. RHB25-C09]QMI04360.1 EAL domain-containing protein [Citrobacter sp. RHB25-C09]
MRTRHLVSLVTGVLILSVLVPVGLSIWIAHLQVEKKFLEELDSYSLRVSERTTRVVEQAKFALQQIEAVKSLPCSREHLLAMRRISYSYRYVQEVVYLENNIPRCSSLEQNSSTGQLPPPMRITNDGYRAWYTAQNDLGIKRYMAALGTEHYIVMIDPASFIDVVPFGSWPIDVAIIGTTHNNVIASSRALAPNVLQFSQETTPRHLESHGIIYEIRPFPDMGISIVSWSSTLPLEKIWYRQAFIWVPFGIIIGLLAAAFILRILRRLQSPHHRLQDAINNREIKVHYQPIISLTTGKIVGAEALARWPQTDGSYLSPEIFITLAAQTGLTEPLTRLIVETVFEDMAKWLRQFPEQHISINVESADLLSDKFPLLLNKLLNRHQIPPQQIALELTEREFADPATSSPIIARYRQAGHAIYIDDFGTGYSSLSYLQNLDVDILKIDKSFVDALEFKNVTPHIIEMAKTLKLEMVAEGIETADQENWLRQHGVQYGQGWLYSKALPKEAFILWAEKRL